MTDPAGLSPADVPAPPAAEPPPADPPADPDRCSSSSDGIHHWTDQVEGRERIRTTVQVCGACGRRVELGEEAV